MVLSMRPLATALIYFCDRGRRDELFDFRVLCRKVWRRLKADAWICAGTATGGRAVARGTGDGYRLQFDKDLEDVQDFPSSESSMDPVGSRSLSADGDQNTGTGISYQLMDDDNSTGAA